MIDEFNETHPPIYVKSVNMRSYQTLSQKIMGAVLGGEPPQIAQVYESWTEELHYAGSLVPIEKFVNSKDGLSQQESP